MYDILKEQFDRPSTILNGAGMHVLLDMKYPLFWTELHPYNGDYYHEFNPYFLFNVTRPAIFNLAKTFFVRDGKLPFAQFMVKHFQSLTQLKTLFLIHKDLAPLVPEKLREKFLVWEISQKKRPSLREAKKVSLSFFANEIYAGKIEDFQERVKILSELRPDAEVALHVRTNPLFSKSLENTYAVESLRILFGQLSSHSCQIIESDELIQTSNFPGEVFLDLAPDKFVIADSFLDFYAASRGAGLAHVTDRSPKNEIFSLNLSLNHKLHICTFPKTSSIFADILLHQKNATKDMLTDPSFHDLIRQSKAP